MEYWNVVFVVLGTRNNRAKFWLLRWTGGGGIFFEGDVKDLIAILEKDAEEWCFQQVKPGLLNTYGGFQLVMVVPPSYG